MHTCDLNLLLVGIYIADSRQLWRTMRTATPIQFRIRRIGEAFWLYRSASSGWAIEMKPTLVTSSENQMRLPYIIV